MPTQHDQTGENVTKTAQPGDKFWGSDTFALLQFPLLLAVGVWESGATYACVLSYYLIPEIIICGQGAGLACDLLLCHACPLRNHMQLRAEWPQIPGMALCDTCFNFSFPFFLQKFLYLPLPPHTHTIFWLETTLSLLGGGKLLVLCLGRGVCKLFFINLYSRHMKIPLWTSIGLSVQIIPWLACHMGTNTWVIRNMLIDYIIPTPSLVHCIELVHATLPTAVAICGIKIYLCPLLLFYGFCKQLVFTWLFPMGALWFHWSHVPVDHPPFLLFWNMTLPGVSWELVDSN